MKSLSRSGKVPRSLLVGLFLGLAIVAGLLYAHVSGRLTGVYHALGLHDLVAAAPADGQQQNSAPNIAGHAGHGGTSVPLAEGTGKPSALPGYTIVTVSPERQQLIGVRTGKVERGKLLMSTRAVGIIETDQTRLAHIQTRVDGWVTKVYANFIGQNVQKGDPLLEIYSPELAVTQQEYLIALGGGLKSLPDHADLALHRLELRGVAPEEIKQLQTTRKASDTLLLRAPITGRVLLRNVLEGTYVQPTTELYRIADLSVVWLQAKIYEYELPHIEIGQPVRITLVSQPEVEVWGKVAFIEPVFQEATRTVNVRVEIENPKDQIKPGMYADLLIEHDMGEGILIPESALLRTGERTLAFRVLSEGRFEPVEVKIGGRFGDRFRLLAGLAVDDTVVTSANFLIDAESRLKSATSAMGGHQHGSGIATPIKSDSAPQQAPSGVLPPGASETPQHDDATPAPHTGGH